jgi:hypothetical protein
MRGEGIDHLTTIPGSEPRADVHLDAPHSQRYLLANGLPAAAAGEDDAAYALRLLAEQACESEDPPLSSGALPPLPSGALGNQTVLSKRSARQQEANKQVWLARRAVQDPAPPLACVAPPRRPAARALMLHACVLQAQQRYRNKRKAQFKEMSVIIDQLGSRLRQAQVCV